VSIARATAATRRGAAREQHFTAIGGKHGLERVLDGLTWCSVAVSTNV
jgi:hypothetical protein